MQHVKTLLANFAILASAVNCEPYGSGHVNDTFCCQLDTGEGVLLQRINHYVFQDVDKLMHNVATVVDHVANINQGRQCLKLFKTLQGQRYQYLKGEYWRAFNFIPSAKTLDEVCSPELAFEGGQAFGKFILQLVDLSEPLYETIPNFHNLSHRFIQLSNAIAQDQHQRASQARDLIQRIWQYQDEMLLIQTLRDNRQLSARITHNDTKFNNVLLDKYNQAICVIDLDTVMPGLVHFDFADAVRIICNTAPEDAENCAEVDIDFDRFDAFCRGFLPQLGPILKPLEKDTLVEALPLMPYMLAIRFLTDHLQGDQYFKIHQPSHNLIRARAQLALSEKMRQATDKLQHIMARYF